MQNSMECTGCKLNIFDFGVITETKESLFNFLFEHKVLSRTISCNQCRETIEADIDNENFRCRRYGADVIQKRRRKLSRCSFYQRIYKGTWFEQCCMPIKTSTRLTSMWILTNPPKHNMAIESFGLSNHTFVDWFSFCREVCLDWCEKNSIRLGGPGSVVEIDGAKIGKRKYNRGLWLEGYWIFGGYER
ncbi:hypothetical protein RF11_03727 [Thelohanellus kitauei]|uniref:Uncharacterized protein n=1 Tax=Thelohanellus kitauei TaxID=669202 RepID=A0A0C2MUB1_THEKT|nr:hypothetical protein RF11_03727 [Thelohanellus kitauei]